MAGWALSYLNNSLWTAKKQSENNGLFFYEEAFLFPFLKLWSNLISIENSFGLENWRNLYRKQLYENNLQKTVIPGFCSHFRRIKKTAKFSNPFWVVFKYFGTVWGPVIMSIYKIQMKKSPFDFFFKTKECKLFYLDFFYKMNLRKEF